jgi:putative transposase
MAQERFGLSERHACRTVGQPRSTQRRPAQVPGDRDLRARLHEIARSRPRAGYRTAHALLCREGWVLNRKKVLRIWREEGLKVQPRHRKRRRPARGEQAHRAERPGHVWAIDFQFDATSDGRMIKIANVVDEFTREALAGRVHARAPPMSWSSSSRTWFSTAGLPSTSDATTGPR